MSLPISALLWSLAVFFAVLGLGLALWIVANTRWQFSRAQKQMERAQSEETEEPTEASRWDANLANLARLGQKLRKMGTPEDRNQLLQAGFRQPYALALFLLIRLIVGLAGGILAEIVVLFILHHPPGWAYLLWPFLGFAAGVLAPKFLLEARAKQRLEGINTELPFFVDLLALLQGIGLSLEQSLISVTAAGDTGLPLISSEMREVSKQMAIGKPRVEAMQKLADVLQDPDFRELSNLLRQIDKYGGDVAVPLREFSERLQEKRQMMARERAGKLNAKMIVVLVLTMLPGLVIITAGPAFTILVKALHHL
jgi:tight adherence protein C